MFMDFSDSMAGLQIPFLTNIFGYMMKHNEPGTQKKTHTGRGEFISEPEDFLSLAERMPKWALMIALIGEGQEIHNGEEAGISQWNDALQKMKDKWTVHCPQKIARIFSDKLNLVTNQRLDLTMTLRSHLAEDVVTWVELLLRGEAKLAQEKVARIYNQGFDIYITRDLEEAKYYVRERYAGQDDKRYGLIASSKATNLEDYGIHVNYQFTSNLKVGEWFNSPPSSRWSCCALHDVATEFQCQGLELDFPIVGWGKDLRWDESNWKTPRITKNNKARDPQSLGLIVIAFFLRGVVMVLSFSYPMNQLCKVTFEFLIAAGIRALPVVSFIDGNGIMLGKTLA